MDSLKLRKESLKIRGSKWHLRRRVPERYSSVDPRREFTKSLHTDSFELAKEKAVDVWKAQIAGWEAKLAGKSKDAKILFEQASELARVRGFQYLSVTQVADLPVEEVLSRVEAIQTIGGRPDKSDAQALLGALDVPIYSVSEALSEYWTLTRDKVLRKSKDQLRRWENPRKKAIRNFIDVVGDKPIDAITRDDMLLFRSWWVNRVEFEGLTANSANKDLIHFGSVLKTVNAMKKLGIDLPVAGLALDEGKQKQRPAFSIDWITNRLLAPGALDGLDAAARTIFLGMINTGARPSELANLQKHHIKLDHRFPHIVIEPENREVKSKNADRRIPLVGCSLAAMKTHPDGFPKYQDNPALSKEVNDYLSSKGLRETPEHVMYSIRHSFEDRLRRAKIDDRVRAQLFGHPYHREKYGEPGLDELTEAVLTIAI